MKKSINKERGFAGLEVVLLIIVVGLVVGLGWYVWSKNKTTTSTTDTTTKSAATTSTDETANWQSFTNAKDGYSVRVPDGWKLVYYTDQGFLTTLDTNGPPTPTSVSYSPGTKATVTTISASDFGSAPTDFTIVSNFNSIYYTVGNISAPITPTATIVKSGTMTLGSVTANKYIYTQTGDDISTNGTPQGTKIVTYVFTYKGKTLYASHEFTPADKDQTSLVEKILATLK